MKDDGTWCEGAVRPGWFRVSTAWAAPKLRASWVPVEEVLVPGVGSVLIAPTWGMDLLEQQWHFAEPSADGLSLSERVALRDLCVAAVGRACSSVSPEQARAIMEAAFSAYTLGGAEAVFGLVGVPPQEAR